jgi:integrase
VDINLPYVQQPSGKKHYRYRRKVPEFLRQALGKTEIIKPLGSTPAEVLRHYDRAHREAEAEIKAAIRGKPSKPTSTDKTALEKYQWAMRHVAGWNLGDPDEVGIMAERLEQAGEADLYRALVVPHDRPEPTLTDAVKLYLKEKIEGTPDETKKRQRVDRVKGHVVKALGRGDPEIGSFTRADARGVRDHMLTDGDMSPATVHRYLNDLRAIVNHAIAEMDLKGVANPFNGLEVKRDKLAKEARNPFTEGQLKATRRRMLGHASVDLQRIWRILEGTGCRLAEVTGLMVGDVHTEGDLPYLDLRPHPHRRLKNDGSVRRVPLVGDALRAAQEAVEAVGATEGNAFVFPAYGREGGATVASKALMKHVRKAVADPKVTVHSLRHTLKDKMLAVEVSSQVQDMILGHSSGQVSDDYGGPQSDRRLGALTKALEKVFG